ncbi:transglycosylase family protein [Streptomyces sp. NPDC005805]|uniref:transglycosylase family protein n=1 Tax=Streptomyces sp. NPDC005805 TaxID=3157068 RepID=UPI0033D41B3E
MLSGNGRHRRPRQAPAIVVAAGVTGSAIAIPLLGAGSASAADAATWDRVAECESGGNWTIDTGNGYYGGLQLSQENWEDFGGTAYAERADLASRSQQIAVAEKVLQAQGPEAWQACAVVGGLTADGDADPGVQPGDLLPSEPAPSTTPDADTGTGTGSDGTDRDSAKSGSVDETDGTDGTGSGETGAPEGGAPDATEKEEEPAKEVDPSADADAGGSAPEGEQAVPEGTGKHRGTPAPEESETATPEATDQDNADVSRENGRHASRGDGSARDGVTGAAPEGTYTVQDGDNLWTIAADREVPGGWAALYAANEETVGGDPDLILPGQSLDLGLGQE